MAVPQTQTSGGARLAVMYITVGAIIDVWSALWFVWLGTHAESTDRNYFWCSGFFLTGLTLVVIGLALGRIGRAARQAETPVTSSAPPQPTAVTATAPMPTAPQATVIPGNGQGLPPTARAGAALPSPGPQPFQSR